MCFPPFDDDDDPPLMLIMCWMWNNWKLSKLNLILMKMRLFARGFMTISYLWEASKLSVNCVYRKACYNLDHCVKLAPFCNDRVFVLFSLWAGPEKFISL